MELSRSERRLRSIGRYSLFAIRYSLFALRLRPTQQHLFKTLIGNTLEFV
jgi:hypothetical protein